MEHWKGIVIHSMEPSGCLAFKLAPLLPFPLLPFALSSPLMLPSASDRANRSLVRSASAAAAVERCVENHAKRGVRISIGCLLKMALFCRTSIGTRDANTAAAPNANKQSRQPLSHGFASSQWQERERERERPGRAAAIRIW